MNDEQKSQQPGVYVDYELLTPFGKLSLTQGPFNTSGEAKTFIEGMTERHGRMLISSEQRQVK